MLAVSYDLLRKDGVSHPSALSNGDVIDRVRFGMATSFSRMGIIPRLQNAPRGHKLAG